MDSKMFRLPTSPNIVRQKQPVDVRKIATNQNIPAPDSRFPGWPAPMADDPTVVPPPTDIFSCTKSECRRATTGLPGGIGTERKESVPDLFGTYNIPYITPAEPVTYRTSRFEGGRNSLRGAAALI